MGERMNPLTVSIPASLTALPQALAQMEADPSALGRLALLYYVLFTRPSPAWGLIDFYLGQPIEKLKDQKYKVGFHAW